MKFEARVRLAWGVALLASVAMLLDVPGVITQRDGDLGFTARLAEVRRAIDALYLREVDDDRLADAAVAGMMLTLDPNSAYVPPAGERRFEDQIEGRFVGIGVYLAPQTKPEPGPDGEVGPLPAVTVAAPIPGGPAEEAGVRRGDRIVAVDGEPVLGMRTDEVQPLIVGPEGETVTLTLQADGEGPREVAVVRRNVQVPQVVGLGRPGRRTWWADEAAGVGYVRLLQFTPETGAQVLAKIGELREDGLRALVLDLRGNPGGLLGEARALLEAFLPAGVTLYSTRGPAVPTRVVTSIAEPLLPELPVVVLVDGLSASASEVLAGALQDHGRATVVGQRTFGKGSVQQTVPLRTGDGGLLKLTVAAYHLPDGRSVQRLPGAESWGVEPDVVVEPPTTRPAGDESDEDDPALDEAVRLAREAWGAWEAAR